jgi:hypothetical protein
VKTLKTGTLAAIWIVAVIVCFFTIRWLTFILLIVGGFLLARRLERENTARREAEERESEKEESTHN